MLLSTHRRKDPGASSLQNRERGEGMAFNSSFSSVHKVKSLDRKAALQLGDLILPTYASKQIGRLHPQAAFLKVPDGSRYSQAGLIASHRFR